MQLNERLQICLLALASRHPQHTIDLDTNIPALSSLPTKGWTSSTLIDQLQRLAPDLLQASARLIIDVQRCEIVLLDDSIERLLCCIHCSQRVPYEAVMAGCC